MIVSVMKGTAFCSAAVLAGYIREWLCDRKKEFQDMEILHPVRQWMEEYQESFEQLSRSFCMVPQMAAEGAGRGERIMQSRLTENRLRPQGSFRK